MKHKEGEINPKNGYEDRRDFFAHLRKRGLSLFLSVGARVAYV